MQLRKRSKQGIQQKSRRGVLDRWNTGEGLQQLRHLFSSSKPNKLWSVLKRFLSANAQIYKSCAYEGSQRKWVIRLTFNRGQLVTVDILLNSLSPSSIRIFRQSLSTCKTHSVRNKFQKNSRCWAIKKQAKGCNCHLRPCHLWHW